LIVGVVSCYRLTFAHTDDVYSLMENIVTVAVPEIQLSDNNGVSTTYPSLTRFSWHFIIYYIFIVLFARVLIFFRFGDVLRYFVLN